MHYARIESSDRLRKVLAMLSDMRPHSTMEIILAAEVCAVNSIIAELRMNGFTIDCHRQKGKMSWEYTLISTPMHAPHSLIA
jgi:biotin operon repressor